MIIASFVLLMQNGAIINAQERVEHFSFEAYKELSIPILSNPSNANRKIRIAIVDDGFNLNHELIQPFLTSKPDDIPNNHLDDDGNGFVDDSYGWNVADNENSVSVPEGLEYDFYHGTMVASIISTVFLESYGAHAKDILELIPVKAVSNKDITTYIKKGYQGIEYAITRKVDIICCAWSGGELTHSQKGLLKEASSKGITIIGAAGNHFNKTLNPAADENVIAVTAIDSTLTLIPTSNFGIEIDFVAPGSKVRAGHPLDNRAFFYGDGTSASTALVAGAYGVVLSQCPACTKTQIVDALKYTARSVNQFNSKYAGKLGAGLPQLSEAIQYLADPKKQTHKFNPVLSEGSFLFYPKDTIKSYTVNPNGAFYGFELQIESKSKKKNNYVLEISSEDSSYLLNGRDHISTQKLLSVGNRFTIKNQSKRIRNPIKVTYEPIIIDSSRLYCKDVKYLYAPKNGLTDGSGTFSYSNKCDCRWIIKAPENKRIKIEVTFIDTQANKDFLWIFEGSKSLQENLIAKLSGTNTPPIIISSSNELLLWFLSDESVTHQGWEINYSWVD